MIVPVRPQEQLLLDLLNELPAGRLLCNTVGRAQFAAAYAERHPAMPVACWFLDLYQLERSRTIHEPLPANLKLFCAADPPAEPYDLVVWAFSRQGDGELLRETLQIGHERLVPGGRFIAAIDYARDQWLHEQLRRMFTKVTRRENRSGVVYLAAKTTPLRKLKSFSAEFAFRDGERLIQMRTRPGVFSHRELDGGARALLKSMRIESGQRVLDLGCGSGAVGLAAAVRVPEAAVTAIDSSARAIEATLWAKDRHNAQNLAAALDCDGRTIGSAAYDLVLANPPYYSDFRLADLFVRTAARALSDRGLLLVVTKTPDWYLEHLAPAFTEINPQPVSNYVVISAEKNTNPTR
jgi:16S rRNA (guanine1207-N2)-methyltransferase